MPKNGFTLIEILIAISIIAIIFGVVISSITAIQKNARDTQRQSDLRSIQSALEHFYADHNYFPQTLPTTALTSDPTLIINTKTYLQKIPRDPVDNSAYGYESVPGNCDNASTNKCIKHCLFTKLENGPTTFFPSPPCGTGTLTGAASYTDFNLQLSPP